jgi:hypothetical protein
MHGAHHMQPSENDQIISTNTNNVEGTNQRIVSEVQDTAKSSTVEAGTQWIGKANELCGKVQDV